MDPLTTTSTPTERWSPTSASYGSTPQGTPVSKALTITNPGNLSLTVSSIALPAGYQLTPPVSFPLRVAPGAQTSVNVQLTATSAGVFNGKLSIGSNDSSH